MDYRTRVLLSMQRALWDMVTPKLRGVSVGWIESETTVSVSFLYDCEVDDDLCGIVSEVETSFIADFDSVNTEFVALEHRVPLPRELESHLWWAYLRREE